MTVVYDVGPNVAARRAHRCRTMPGLDYPFVYECANCGAETTVERADALGLHTNPDSINAVEIVLQQRGWMRDDIKGLLFCPECADPGG